MRRSDPEPQAVMSPESAVWLVYAGLVQGLRWRRHLSSGHPPTKVPQLRARSRTAPR